MASATVRPHLSPRVIATSPDTRELALPELPPAQPATDADYQADIAPCALLPGLLLQAFLLQLQQLLLPPKLRILPFEFLLGFRLLLGFSLLRPLANSSGQCRQAEEDKNPEEAHAAEIKPRKQHCIVLQLRATYCVHSRRQHAARKHLTNSHFTAATVMIVLHLLPVALLGIIMIRLARIQHEGILVEQGRHQFVCPVRRLLLQFLPNFPANCAGGKTILDVLQKARFLARLKLLKELSGLLAHTSPPSVVSCFSLNES